MGDYINVGNWATTACTTSASHTITFGQLLSAPVLQLAEPTPKKFTPRIGEHEAWLNKRIAETRVSL